MRILLHLPRLLAPLALFATAAAPPLAGALQDDLAASGFEVIYESYPVDNWELMVSKADGTGVRNLTRTPDVHELYPQVSPDGKWICFLVDTGSGRETVRSVWVMKRDGTGRLKVADRARQPAWAPDSETIAYLPQEYKKWNIVDYYSKGLNYFHLPTGETRPHPNADKLHHLYNIHFAPNGKWIVATVHAGMGYGHAILLIEAEGDRVLDLKIPGCRPCASPGKNNLIAWGPGDHEIAVAPIDYDAETPTVGPKVLRIVDPKMKTYHVDWSPDGRFLSLSRGPTGKGDLSKPGTHAAACEMVGVYAQGWDIFVVPAGAGGTLDLNHVAGDQALALTADGKSNKESAWLPPVAGQ